MEAAQRRAVSLHLDMQQLDLSENRLSKLCLKTWFDINPCHSLNVHVVYIMLLCLLCIFFQEINH
jgi:hypothetical protein